MGFKGTIYTGQIYGKCDDGYFPLVNREKEFMKDRDKMLKALKKVLLDIKLTNAFSLDSPIVKAFISTSDAPSEYNSKTSIYHFSGRELKSSLGRAILLSFFGFSFLQIMSCNYFNNCCCNCKYHHNST